VSKTARKNQEQSLTPSLRDATRRHHDDTSMHGPIWYTFYERAHREQEGPTKLRSPLFLAGERGRVSLVPESGWPLVCGFVERISSSHCAIRTTLRQLGLFQFLSQEVFAWLPGLSQELVDRVAISPSSSLPDRSTRGSRRSAPSTSISWPLIVPRLVPSGCSPISTDASSSHPAWSNTTSRALTRRSPRSAARWNPTALEI